MPAVGTSAPDFEMLNDEGKPVKLSDYRGKKVVLYFYPADFTAGCELQACSFRDNYEKIAAKGAVVIGVSPDGVERHNEFRKALNLPFNLLVDADHTYATAWNAYGPRQLDDGSTVYRIFRSQWTIDENGKIIDAQEPVKANESIDLALKSLGA